MKNNEIKKYENFYPEYGKDDFNMMKNGIINKINDLLNEYDIFTNYVSSKYWRRTGTHFTQLKQMKKDIIDFKEISKNDLNFLRKMKK